MKVISTKKELARALETYRNEQKTVGFVPTMGALHQGHASLVRQCVAENDVCVVSVFVNPTQFNNKEDLRLYPRTLDADCILLESLGVNIVFSPSDAEMYPEEDTRQFDFGMLDKVMEGTFRPGHFNGVAQIVSKLFEAVQPDKAYFGEKDFQQLAIIQEMVRQLHFPVKIVPVSIVREASGLAMSSRNARLSELQRQEATNIYRILKESRAYVGTKSVAECRDFVINRINKIDSLDVEYFEIVDGKSLQAISQWTDSEDIVGCVAVFCGEVRLIDNIRYK